SSTWMPVGGVFNKDVYALGLVGSQLYAGGAFTTAGGTSTLYLARLNASGSWEAVPGGTLDGTVRALLGVSGDLYAGGEFQSLSGDGHFKRIAKFAGGAWMSLNSGLDGPVYALAPGPSGSVYAGGAFTREAAAPFTLLYGVGRWNGSWNNLAMGMNG